MYWIVSHSHHANPLHWTCFTPNNIPIHSIRLSNSPKLLVISYLTDPINWNELLSYLTDPRQWNKLLSYLADPLHWIVLLKVFLWRTAAGKSAVKPRN